MTDYFFEWYDYFFFAGVLAISLAIGITFAFTGDKQRTLNEYFTGGGALGFVPVAASLYMTVNSGINVLGSTRRGSHSLGCSSQLLSLSCGSPRFFIN